MRIHRRFVHAGAVLVLAGALAGCSSDSTATSKQASSVTTTSTASSASFCDRFRTLAEQREQKGEGGVRPGSDEAAPDGEEGWDERIATTAELAAAAPDEHQEDAQTYVELVKARATLFAAHGYPASLDEIPQGAVQAFIAEHRDEQQAANRLIEFAKDECGAA